jgi:hypothetical protein
MSDSYAEMVEQALWESCCATTCWETILCTAFDQQDLWRHDRQRTAKSSRSIHPKKDALMYHQRLVIAPLNAKR